jgi:PAS domain S-box-containing protein
MLIRLDRDLRYRFISQAYLEMTGRRPEQVMGKRLSDILGDEDFQAIRPYVEKVLQGDRVEFDREVHYQGVGTRFLHVIYTPEKDDSGTVTGWIVSMRDITERKRAEEEQKRAADAEQILIRELQHRTNNLLAVIQGIAQKTLSGPGSLDEARKIFEGRLLALAGTYRRLTKSNWSGVSLGAFKRRRQRKYRVDHCQQWRPLDLEIPMAGARRPSRTRSGSTRIWHLAARVDLQDRQFRIRARGLDLRNPGSARQE